MRSTYRWIRSTTQAGASLIPPHRMDTDAHLIARCLRNDDGAWREIVERYQRLVYSIPARLRLPPDDCDDVFQNVFLALYRHLGSIRDGQGLAKWLITTAQRECYRTAKRARSRQAGEGGRRDATSGTEPCPEHDLETLERQHAVHRALQELGGPCERLLRAVFLDKNTGSYAEIARQLGIPVGSIGPTRQRCLVKLAEVLGEQWGVRDRHG